MLYKRIPLEYQFDILCGYSLDFLNFFLLLPLYIPRCIIILSIPLLHRNCCWFPAESFKCYVIIICLFERLSNNYNLYYNYCGENVVVEVVMIILSSSFLFSMLSCALYGISFHILDIMQRFISNFFMFNVLY